MHLRRRSLHVLAAALCGAALVPVTAAAAPTLPGQLTNPLASSGDCNVCHRFVNPAELAAEPPYAPQVGWVPSMMGNSARDPVFWAAVALAAQDDPGVETEDCIRCHSPNAFLQGRASATAIEELEAVDLEGVTCEFCHRMTDQGELGNGQYSLEDTLVGATVVRHGPFDYTDGVPMPVPGATGHAVVQDDFTGSSELCGTCHDVTTARERVDDDGVSMGTPFNEQRTYSEWQGSAFATPGDGFRSCQDCHMPEIPDSAACAEYAGLYEHRTGNRRHDLMGANRFMLELLQEDAAVGFETAAFGNALDRIDEFLATAATMDVVAPEGVDMTQGLSRLSVTVTNETGHKLPSGYAEGRVMWLEVLASYDGVVVFSSGTWSQADGTIEGDAQVRRYEGVSENYESGVANHLLLNNYWREDTRIPPRGLQPDIETDPVGDRYTLGNDGAWPNFDVHAYAFEGRPDVADATPADATDDVLTVDVRLLYLINTPGYIQQLADDNATTEVGTELAARFDLMGGATPVVLATQSLEVPITAFGGGGGSSSSGGVDSASSSQGEAGEAGATEGPGADTAMNPATSTGDAGAVDAGSGGEEGCGCRSGGGRPLWGLWVVVGGGLLRRRGGRRR